MIYHGRESFEPAKIAEYAGWDVFKHLAAPSFPVYLGKISELVAGSLLLLGLLTPLASLLLCGTMLYISFFIGPGAWNLDGILFDKKTATLRQS